MCPGIMPQACGKESLGEDICRIGNSARGLQYPARARSIRAPFCIGADGLAPPPEIACVVIFAGALMNA